MDPYRQKILDHYRHPRNFGRLAEASHRAAVSNPICGDEVEIAFKVLHGRIAEIKFTGRGCAISTAASSLLTEALQGRELRTARRFTPREAIELLGAPISSARRGCACLGFSALRQALALAASD